MTAPLLNRRALNRATLARQLLLERAPMAPYDAIHHLVGLQAQTPQTWYLTLWSRLADFDPESVGTLLVDRRVVRLPLMRSTIHLVTDDDALMLRPFAQPSIDRSLRGTFGRQLVGIDLAELEVAARELLDGTPRTPSELTRVLAARWPEPDALTLSNAVRAVVPLVQVPPRGVWRQSGAVRLAPLDAWLDRPLPDAVDAGTVVLRYLAAFGPASVMDVQAWSGVRQLRSAMEELRPQLLAFRDESGRELFDLPGAPRPDPATPAPVRFLADFDNLLLGHADRSRFIGASEREALTYRQEGPIPGTLLVDGFAAGAWHVQRDGSSATLVIRLVRPLSGEDEAALREEADAMLRFSQPAAASLSVELRLPAA
jgi:hypothetical protein